MTADRARRGRDDRFAALLADLLEEIATESVSPAASSVAALTVSFAAALIAKSALRSTSAMRSAAATAAQADSLRRRALALASLNAEAYERAVAALAGGTGSEREHGAADAAQKRDLEIRDALVGTGDALSELLDVACDVCLLANLVAEEGKPGERPDAAVAATQAEAGARAAVHLIEINLLSSGFEDVKRKARNALAAASKATERALAAEP
jgi:formiminotetrahydrofolate cyclodeaminase